MTEIENIPRVIDLATSSRVEDSKQNQLLQQQELQQQRSHSIEKSHQLHNQHVLIAEHTILTHSARTILPLS